MSKGKNFHKKTDEIINQCESELIDLSKIVENEYLKEKMQIKMHNKENKKDKTTKK